MEEFKRPCYIRGYRLLLGILEWTAAVGEELVICVELVVCMVLSVVAFAILRLARAIACDGIDSNNGPLGLGRPSFGLK